MSFKATGPKTRPDRVKPPTSHQAYDDRPETVSRRSSSSASSIASFHSAHFPPEEEARLVAASNDFKLAANAQFAKQDYSSALSTYDKAVAELPNYLNYELAVLSSNIAACHLNLKEWRDALQASETGMDRLERVMPMPKSNGSDKQEKDNSAQHSNDRKSTSKEAQDSAVIELSEDMDEAATAEMLKNLDLSDQRKTDILRIRTKLLLRRARARNMLGTQPPSSPTTQNDTDKKPDSKDAFSTGSTYTNLSAALSDYQLLATPEYFSGLPTADKKTVQTALVTLPPIVEKAKEKELGEMMGKLKELGNGILKPFGLSTDMFRMEKDKSTGGMSLKFDGGGGK